MRTSFDEPIEPAVQSPETMKKCPFCAERIQQEAIKCRYCGEFLTGKPPVAAPAPKPGVKWYNSTTTIVLAFLMLGPLAIPLVWTNPKYSLAVKVAISVVMIVLTILLCYAMAAMYRNLMNQVRSLGM